VERKAMKVNKYLIWSPLVLAMMSLLVYNSCATYTFQAEDRIGKDATIASSKDIRSVYWELKGCGGPLFKSAREQCDILNDVLPAQLQEAGYTLAASKDQADLRIKLKAGFFTKKYGDEDFFLFVIPTGSCFFCNFDGRPSVHKIQAVRVKVIYRTDLQKIGKAYRLYDQHSMGIATLAADLGNFVLEDIQLIRHMTSFKEK